MATTELTSETTRQETNAAERTSSNGQRQPTQSVDLVSFVHDRQSEATYESIDRLLHDTTTHSAELIWRVMAMPDMVRREAARMQEEATERLRGERDRQRFVLTQLLEELTACRHRAETLDHEVGELLSDLGRWSERATTALAEIDLPPSPPATPDSELNGGEPAVEADVAPTAEAELAAEAEESTDDHSDDTAWWETELAATLASLDEPTDLVAPEAAENGELADAETEEDETVAALADDAQLGQAGDTGSEGGGVHGFSLVVHGARPTAALSLRSYLSNLDHVNGVVVRDYAADELHAQLSVTRPLRIDDFQGWHSNAAITVVSAGEDALEIQLDATGGD